MVFISTILILIFGSVKHFLSSHKPTQKILRLYTLRVCKDLIHDDTEVNTFDVAEADVSIEEDFTKPPDVNPGDTITKKPRAVNTGEIPCYVRMRVVVSNEDLCEPLSINSGWTKGSDGFYYWSSVLQPGEKTGNLFDFVKIKSGIDKKDITSTSLDVQVYAEAADARNNSADAAWAALNP